MRSQRCLQKIVLCFGLIALTASCKTQIITTSSSLTNTGTGAGTNNGNSGGNSTPSLYNYFLYMWDSTGLSLYKVDSSNGTLSSPTTLSLCGGFMPDATQTYAYVACGNDNTVKTYTIDPSTGNLTLAQTVSTTVAGGYPVLDPNGHFMILMDGSGGLNYLSINSSTGVVSAPAGTFGTSTYCNYPVNISIDSTGKYLYQSCYNSQGVAIYSLNATTGQPSYVGFQASPSGGNAYVGTSPTSPSVIFVDQDTDHVSTFSINSSTGLLTLVSNLQTAGTMGALVYPCWGYLDSLGSLFFTVGQNGSPGLAAYQLASNGTLTAVSAAIDNTWVGAANGWANNIMTFQGLPYAYSGNGTDITMLNYDSSTGAFTYNQNLSSPSGTGGSQGLRIAAP